MRIQSQSEQYPRTASAPDPATTTGVRAILVSVGLDPDLYRLDEIARRAADYKEQLAESKDDPLESKGLDAESFFEWAYEAENGESGPDLYVSNPGTGMPDLWTLPGY